MKRALIIVTVLAALALPVAAGSSMTKSKVSGNVTWYGESAEPGSGIVLVFTVVVDGIGYPSMNVRPDSHGRYRVKLPAGEHHVSVSPATGGTVLGVTPADIETVAGSQTVDFTLAPK